MVEHLAVMARRTLRAADTRLSQVRVLAAAFSDANHTASTAVRVVATVSVERETRQDSYTRVAARAASTASEQDRLASVRVLAAALSAPNYPPSTACVVCTISGWVVLVNGSLDDLVPTVTYRV